MFNFRVSVNPHNDLENLARYHVDIVKEKLASGNKDAILLDCTSAIIAMAFSVEAFMNYVGAIRILDWKERSPFKTKVSALEAKLNFKFDKAIEPYKTIALLKEARDTMAHGQPVQFQVSAQSDKHVSKAMRPTWSSASQPDVVLAAYEQVRQFKNFLFARARITLGASLTSAIGGSAT
jgi:hypothetical protein